MASATILPAAAMRSRLAFQSEFLKPLHLFSGDRTWVREPPNPRNSPVSTFLVGHQELQKALVNLLRFPDGVHLHELPPHPVVIHQGAGLPLINLETQADGLLIIVGALDELRTIKIADPLALRRNGCLLYTSPSPRDVEESRMPSSA